MKLYYSPGACSLSPHIVSNEAGLDVEFIKVDLGTKLTETGEDFSLISPKNYVPTLVLDDGATLTEGVAIVQYLAELADKADLLPQGKTLARYRALEMLNFLSTELHKAFAPLFSKDTSDDLKAATREKVKAKFDQVDKQLLGDKPFLLGDNFTVADAYGFTLLNWSNFVDIELPQNLKAYQARVASRPAVQQTLKEEGLA